MNIEYIKNEDFIKLTKKQKLDLKIIILKMLKLQSYC